MSDFIDASIADAGEEHAELLAALHQGSFDKPWAADEFATLLAMPDTRGLIALETGNAPVGMTLFRNAADEGEILTLAVEPGSRRRGVATMLVGAALNRLQGVAASVFLEVARSNRAARELYLAKGFVEVGRRPDYYGSTGTREDAVVMRVDLA